MINLVLLTGFLGAGKTTMIKAMLDTYKEKRIGIIMNEFADLNVDGVLIRKDGIEMMELTNGSIFCACLREDFIESLIRMSGSDIDYLFIEASGLADPSNMAKILKLIAPKVVRPYDYKGALCIVDAENFIDSCELLPALHRQVEYSSTAIVNKTDLAAADQIEKVSDKLVKINPSINMYFTTFCRVDIGDVINNLTRIDEEKDTTNTYESRPKAVILRADEKLPYEELKLFINEIGASAYRIKGFADTDKGLVEISATWQNLTMEPWMEGTVGTEIAVISSVGIKILSVIAKAVEKYLNGKIHF